MSDLNRRVEDWAREWNCRAYVFKHKFGEEVIVEFDDYCDGESVETILYELDSCGVHYSEDGLGELHIDTEEFGDYLDEFDAVFG